MSVQGLSKKNNKPQRSATKVAWSNTEFLVQKPSFLRETYEPLVRVYSVVKFLLIGHLLSIKLTAHAGDAMMAATAFPKLLAAFYAASTKSCVKHSLQNKKTMREFL